MSGGSYNYLYSQIEDEYVGRMYDIELNDMMKDLTKLLKILEWWQSGDRSEEGYRKIVAEFKSKWFELRDERLKGYIDNACEKLKSELLTMIN